MVRPGGTGGTRQRARNGERLGGKRLRVSGTSEARLRASRSRRNTAPPRRARLSASRLPGCPARGRPGGVVFRLKPPPRPHRRPRPAGFRQWLERRSPTVRGAIPPPQRPQRARVRVGWQPSHCPACEPVSLPLIYRN
ncbi:unnamed protein product [Gulo gulo]|uniref:Uncharacterized protein n=1 Tax=Gulo gulo TaxID=48420 RepID=A0A9X9LX23_GULGU|nr:unnamed protein product [Gulo gulo]